MRGAGLFALDGFGSDASLLAAVGYGLIGLACPVIGLLLTQWLSPRLFGTGLAAYVVRPGFCGRRCLASSPDSPRPLPA